MLPEKFTEPKGFRWGHTVNSAGSKIRYGYLLVEGARGTVILLPGFREVIEKYFEVAREFAAEGFSVWIMDWAGQGGSERFVKDNPQKMHSRGYRENIDMLHQFAEGIRQKYPGPLYLAAHSMGAHIGLRCMREHPELFEKAVLSSPMFDIRTPGFFKPIARFLASLAKFFGFLESYVPGGRDWGPPDEVFEGNNKTSDPVRFSVLPEIFREKPELKMGFPTYGWVWNSFHSIDILAGEDHLKKIRTPILMGIAWNDTIVDVEAEKRACNLLPNCTRMDIPMAKHEIWMERFDLRGIWQARVMAFLKS